MNVALRHRCRNPRCRMKLPVPTENEHHGFCARGCHASFYRSRCLVCEDPMRRKRDSQKLGSGHKRCEAEYRKFPRAYDFPVENAHLTTISDESPSKAHSTGIKFGIAGHPPRDTLRCLRDWWWGVTDGDCSLYDAEGLTKARIVLKDGRWHLRSPVTTPSQSWDSQEAAEHGAESYALMAIPLAEIDPKLAARIAKDNSTPHPMGPPLNRPVSYDNAANSKIAFKLGDRWSDKDFEVPPFLRRQA
jgi:hypothetical protein